MGRRGNKAKGNKEKEGIPGNRDKRGKDRNKKK